MAVSFDIARAAKEQMAEVARICRASRSAALSFLPVLHTEAEYSDYFTNTVFADDQVYIAIDSASQKIAGFIAFNSEWVNHLYLLPEFQRRKLGEKLLNVAKEHADSLQLWTFQRNTAAQRFYTQQGFVIVKETDGTHNEEKEPDMLMKWIR